MAKLPKKLQDIIDRKDAYLNAQQDKLQKSVITMQEKFLNDVIRDIVSELDTENGVIKQSTKNIRLINQLESVYESFNVSIQVPLVKEMASSMLGINSFNKDYFKEITLDLGTAKRFQNVVKTTDSFLSARIGITPKGELNTGGFLDSFITDRTLVNDLKQVTIRAVTGQMPIDDYKGLLKYKTQGSKDVLGGFERYYKQNAFDVYQQYDRTYGKVMADEFQLNYALYQGGIIDESRDFCREHNNHVYTRKEVEDFRSWTYDQAVYITGFKDSGSHEGVPSYIENNLSYIPSIDLGSWNCRHHLSWIGKTLAYKLRPELSELEKNLKTNTP